MSKRAIYRTVVLSFIIVLISQVVSAANISPMLPSGMPVNLIMLEELYSQHNKTGDEIVFALADDVVVDGKTYLVKGTPVIGRVTKARSSKSWGRRGTLDVDITSIVPPYGSTITLTGRELASGDSKSAESIGATALIGVSLLGVLAGSAISGKGAVISEGTRFTVFTAEKGSISDVSKKKMNELVDGWYHDKVISSFLQYAPNGKVSVQAALNSMGYNVDDKDVSTEPMDQFHYTVTVHVTSNESASFDFQPFQETHGWKFNTLIANDDLAQRILDQVD